MSDVALIWDSANGAADFGIAANDYVQDGGLDTPIMLSLFTDRRASDTDTLPRGETDPRGFWGDVVPVVIGDETGSRLWLLARAKQTQDTLDAAVAYCKEALQWLLDDGVAAALDVAAVFAARGFMRISVLLTRPGKNPTAYSYDYAWQAQATQATPKTEAV